MNDRKRELAQFKRQVDPKQPGLFDDPRPLWKLLNPGFSWEQVREFWLARGVRFPAKPICRVVSISQAHPQTPAKSSVTPEPGSVMPCHEGATTPRGSQKA